MSPSHMIKFRKLMKLKLTLILAFLSLSALFLGVPKSTFAAGETCCNAGWTIKQDPTTLQWGCFDARSNFTTPTICAVNEPCNGSVCSASVTPTPGVCDSHSQCNLSSYRSNHTGCSSLNNGAWYCQPLGFPTLVITPNPTSGSTPGSGIYCPDGKSINTALGCISTTAEGFVGSILTIAISLGGGIALLLILYGTFIVTTSAGIPDKLNEGQETITAAVQGLVFIIMSIVLLNLIGIKILQIPGL